MTRTWDSDPADRDQEQKGAAGSDNVSFLEQTLWKRLSEPATLEDFGSAWLALLCRAIPGAAQAILAISSDTATPSYTPIAVWPDRDHPTAALSAAADLALAKRVGVAQKRRGDEADAPGAAADVAYPIILEDRLVGVAAVTVSGVPGRDLRDVMRQLQWGTAWVRDMLRHRQAAERAATLERTTSALEQATTALEEEGFLEAARATVTELAMKFDCDRVSIGFVRRGHAAVRAISHSAQFEKRMSLVRMQGAAMDEAIEQRTVLVYPAPDPDEPLALRAHEELSRIHGSAFVATIPLLVDDRWVGALCFERSEARPFDPQTMELLECAASVLGPILEEKRRNDRWLVVKAGESLVRQAEFLVGPQHLGRKLIALGIVAAVTFFYFARAEYRVTADALIQGLVRQSVVASFDGFIKEAPARPGDTVVAGQVLASFDDRDLNLERLRWISEREQGQIEYVRALATGDRTEMNIVRSQIAQADAQIELIDRQLERAVLRAPFDGIVVSGDLSQSIGAAVEKGEVLFELSPLDQYRVVLAVDESQIDDVALGQSGRLVVSSLPDAPLPFVVDKLTPVAASADGRNVFQVEAVLDGVSPRLRPGMEGVGKIDIEPRRLAWIWSRPLLDWARISTWRWLP